MISSNVVKLADKISTTAYAIANLFTPICLPRGDNHQKNNGFLIQTHLKIAYFNKNVRIFTKNAQFLRCRIKTEWIL